ncbi:hypothetical protein, partial [Actinobacillus pleuropneumoniae]|uniref:hypothetical protein n=1 Tax=Actinobacillus pleuropneumoniae TaxID=715 RepID=UPI00227B2A5B
AFKNKYKADDSLDSTKLSLWEKILHRRKGLTMIKLFPQQQNGIPSRNSLSWQFRMVGNSIKWM